MAMSQKARSIVAYGPGPAGCVSFAMLPPFPVTPFLISRLGQPALRISFQRHQRRRCSHRSRRLRSRQYTAGAATGAVAASPAAASAVAAAATATAAAAAATRAATAAASATKAAAASPVAAPATTRRLAGSFLPNGRRTLMKEDGRFLVERQPN